MAKKITADEFIAKSEKWKVGLSAIRKVILNTELEEDIKWGMPTYTLKGKNVVSFCGFKNHFGVWFPNGSFLKDEQGILENAQEGKTRGMRHIKYYANEEVDTSILKTYVLEAIQNQKDGKEIKISRTKTQLPIPQEMKDGLSTKALEILQSFSMSKQNEYIEYITSAKRENTKLRRMDKIIPMIEAGKGLNDQYK